MAKKIMKREHPVKAAAKKENYFTRIFSIYTSSFREIDSNYFYYIFYDLLFLVVAGGLTFLLGYFVQKVSGLSAIANLMDNPDAASQLQFLEQAKDALILTVIMFFVLVALLIVCWSFAKAFIYNRIYSRKFEWKVYLKFLAPNLVFIFVCIIFLSRLPLLIIPEKLSQVMVVLTLVVFPIMLYFRIVYFTAFFRSKKFTVAVSEMFNVGVIRIYKLIIPYILLLVTLIIAIIPFGLIYFVLSRVIPSGLGEIITSVIGLVIIFIIIAWIRLFLVKTVNYVAGKE